MLLHQYYFHISSCSGVNEWDSAILRPCIVSLVHTQINSLTVKQTGPQTGPQTDQMSSVQCRLVCFMQAAHMIVTLSSV